MYLPSVQPVNHLDVYINGDVQLDPQAIIAPGVIIQASPDSKILIRAGACLGMGCVINAYQGVVEIGAGAIIGAGVLIIGTSTIGANACIGAASTIIDTSVETMQIIPPGSLLGDRSRQANADLSPEIAKESHDLETENLENGKTNSKEPEIASATESKPDTETTLETADTQETDQGTKNKPVIGEMYINQLLLTLFPSSRSLDNKQE